LRHGYGLFWLCTLLLIIAAVGGGGQGGRGDMLAQLFAVIVLAQLWRLRNQGGAIIDQGPAWALWLVPVLLALPLLQLLPIPMWLWNESPARREIAGQLAVVGLSPSPHVGLIPLAAERALWSLLPAVALFLSTLALSRHQQRLLLGVVLVLALINVVLGLAQLAQGPESALRFYANTNPTEAVGFFANRNHFACLLVMTLPLTLAGSAWVANEYAQGAPISPLWVAVGILSAVLLILGVALARSRAGLMLGMLAVLLSLPAILSLRKRRGAKRVLALIMGLGLMLSVQFALFGILQRLDTDTVEDGRWQYARITADAASAHAPLGTGLGGFRQAFQPFEAKAGQGPAIINHAHDDYLELWLEGGWLALLPIALLLTALFAAGARAWLGRYESSAEDRLLARTVWISVLVAALHSGLDYPLRTSADNGVVALLFAVALSHAWPRTLAVRPRRSTADAPEESGSPIAGSNVHRLNR
jgi:O-antigen ligase